MEIDAFAKFIMTLGLDMSVAAFVSSIASNLAANLLSNPILALPRYGSRLIKGGAKEQALRRAYTRAFENLTAQLLVKLPQNERFHIETILSEFVGSDQVASLLLNLTLSREPVEMSELEVAFSQLGYDSETLGLSLELAIESFLSGLTRGIMHEAQEPSSPIYNLVSLAHLEALHNQVLTVPTAVATEVFKHLQQAQVDRQRALLKSLTPDWRSSIEGRLIGFVGRENELKRITELVEKLTKSGGYLIVTGEAGLGKSSLLANLVADFGTLVGAYYFIPVNPGPDHQVPLLRSLLAQISLKHKLQDFYISSESRSILAQAFSMSLTEILSKTSKELVFIDGLDQLELDGNEERDFSFLPPVLPPGIVFVLATRADDTLHRLQSLKHTIEYKLPVMSYADFNRILEYRGIHLAPATAVEIYKAMEANPLYLDLVAEELASNPHKDPREIIRYVGENPENLFSFSIDRLKRRRLWRRVIRPTLAALLVAQEPLSARQIRQIIGCDDEAGRDAIRQLGGLLTNEVEGRLQLFHVKLQDYLREDPARPDKKYVFASDEEVLWHKRVAKWCEDEGIVAIWRDEGNDRHVKAKREYARRHYVTHLYLSASWQNLWQVLDSREYGREKVRYDPSTRSYAQDLDLGRRAAAQEVGSTEEQIALLPFLWRYTLLRHSLSAQADRYPDLAFSALVALKRDREAVGLAELLTETLKKTRALSNIATEMINQGRDIQEARLILLQAYSTAGQIARKPNIITVLEPLLLATDLTDVDLLQQLEELILTIDETNVRDSALYRLTDELLKAELCSRALEIASRIEAQSIRDLAFGALIAKLVASHEWDQAESTLALVSDSRGRTLALQTLVSELTRSGLLTRATNLVTSLSNNLDRLAALSGLVNTLKPGEAAEKRQTFLEQAIDLFRSILDPIDSAWAARLLSRTYIFSDQRQGALAILGEATEVARSIESVEKRAQALQDIVDGLSELGEWHLAKEVAYSIDWSFAKAIALDIIIKALISSQEWNLAVAVARSDDNARHRDVALQDIAFGLAMSGQVLQAENLVRSIEDVRDRSWAQQALAKALVESDDLGHAERIMRSIEDVYIRGLALGKLAEEFVRREQWDEANRVAQLIEDQDDRAGLLCSLALESARRSNNDFAMKLLLQVRGTTRATASEEERSMALYGLVAGVTSLRDWDAAQRVASIIGDERARDAALRLIAERLAKAHEWAQAKDVADSIEETRSQDLAYQILAVNLVSSGQDEEAKAVARKIKDLSLQALTLTQIAKTLMKTNRPDEAIRLLTDVETATRLVERGALRIVALDALSKRWRQLGYDARASDLWIEAENVSRSISDSEDRGLALLTLVAWATRDQRWSEAENIARSIQDNRQRATALRGMALKLAGNEQEEQALNLASGVENETDKAWVLDAIVESLAMKGKWSQAQSIAESIKVSSTRSVALQSLAERLAHEGKLEQATAIVQMIDETYVRDNAFRTLAEEYSSQSDWDHAVQTVGSIGNQRIKHLALATVVARLMDKSLLEQAVRLVQGSWVNAASLSETLTALRLANPLLSLSVTMGAQLAGAFTWVDDFLKN